MKKIVKISIILFLISAILLLTIPRYFNKNELDVGATTSAENMYVLTGSRELHYITEDGPILSSVKIPPCGDIKAVSDNKLYSAIRGDDRKAYSNIYVFNNGKKVKDIKLTYSLPWIIKYNEKNKKAYISHVTKLTYHEDNCITVIDTINDIEETNIMFDRDILDFVFTADNQMVVCSRGTMYPADRIDIFELENNTITETIPSGEKISSIAVTENNLVYGVSDMKEDAIVTVFDLNNKGKKQQIKLNYDYPNKVFAGTISGKEYIFITHQDADNGKGSVVTIIDPEKGKIFKELTNLDSPDYICIDDNKVFISSRRNNKIYLIEDFHKSGEFNIERPVRIVRENNN